MKGSYLKEVLKVFGVTILVLLLLGNIPDFEIKYKHFNLLSDILKTDSIAENVPDESTGEEYTPSDSEKELLAVAEDSVRGVETIASANKVKTPPPTTAGVFIEDFSEDKRALASFYHALQKESPKRPVRIGVLGDSFIEADIMTSKLRNLLQAKYGGTGVGFVPVTSPAAQYRQTIHQNSSGWTTYSMVYYKKADWKKFCLSGFYFIPQENASVALKTVNKESVAQTSFCFINQKHTKISVSVNDKAATEYQPAPSESIQQLVFADEPIRSLKVNVKNVDGFTGLGFYLNNKSGVYVDNFSVRGSSGSVLTTMSKELSMQLAQHFQYDLLIIQYGLNVIATDKKWYPSYKKLMVHAIRRLQECYPGVPILMLSVGDKGSKSVDGITTHPGVLPLIEAQRQAASEAKIAFWNTYKAMGGEKSMVQFVAHKPPMAAKDYTHINYLGGDKIAGQLFNSLMNEQDRLVP